MKKFWQMILAMLLVLYISLPVSASSLPNDPYAELSTIATQSLQNKSVSDILLKQNATEPSRYSQGIGLNSVKPSSSALTIAQLRAKFPNGYHWNHKVTAVSNNGDNLIINRNEAYADTVTQYPCATHNGTASVGQYDCNYFDGGIQCFGFAYKLGYDYTGGIRPSTWTVQYSLDNLSVGDIIRYNGHSVFVIAVNNYGGISLAEGNYGYDCSIKWDRYITKTQITNFEWVRKCPKVVHQHNYATTEYEAAHPHKEYQKCSCGATRYTGKTRYLANYSCCKPNGVTLKTGAKNYTLGDAVTFTYTGNNVETFRLYLYRDGVNVYFQSNTAAQSKIFYGYNLEAGNYTAELIPVNEAYTGSAVTTSFTISPKTTFTEPTVTVSGLQLPTVYRTPGLAFTCGGTITSKSDIEYVLVDLYDDCGRLVTGYSLLPSSSTRTVDLADWTKRLDFTKTKSGAAYIYYIKVKNATDTIVLASHKFFCTTNVPPNLSATTIKLDTNVTEKGGLVTARWEKLPTATSYYVYVTKAPYGWSDICKSAITKDNNYAFQMDKTGDYSIYVFARCTNGISAFSNKAPIKVVDKLDVSSYKPVSSVTYNGKIYELYDNPASWRTASLVAKRLGGELTSITDANENAAIHNLIKNNGSKTCYWLGASNFVDSQKKYHWVSGESFTYTNWAEKEPSMGTEHFAMIFKSNGLWNDLPVEGSNYDIANMGFIVEKNAPINNKSTCPHRQVLLL